MPKTRSAKPRRRHVFISHSAVDTWVAQQIAREVQDCGAIPFLDENDIDIGAEFEERLLESLDRADELIVLLTPWALLRPYVWAEIGAAWGRRIPIVVLLHGITIAELQAKPEIPLMLKKRSFIALNEVEAYFKELRGRVLSQTRNRKGTK